jgi:hypothetical protein
MAIAPSPGEVARAAMVSVESPVICRVIIQKPGDCAIIIFSGHNICEISAYPI